MSLLRLLQRLRNGRSGERRGTPPAVEAALRAKRARAHLARKRGRGGRRPGSRLPASLIEDGALDLPSAPDAFDPLFSIDRSIPAGPLPTTQPATTATTPPATLRATPRATTPATRPAATLPSDLFEASGLEAAPTGTRKKQGEAPVPTGREGGSERVFSRPPAARRSPSRPAIPPARPLPRFVVPIGTALAFGLGFAVARPLFEHVWLPRVPLARIAVVGSSVRTPDSIAGSLLASAGVPLDRMDAELVAARVTRDPWIESAESFRLPTGTLLVRVVERRAIARYQTDPEAEIRLLDPAGRPFAGAVGLGGALPLVEGPVDGEQTLSPATLEILAELRRHADLARDPMALTLHLPGSVAIARGLEARSRPFDAAAEELAATDGAVPFSQGGGPEPAPVVEDSLAGESGYVLEIGREGPRALLGQSFLKRRVARLAALLGRPDALVAGARVIDLRFADRAVLRTEPTSG